MYKLPAIIATVSMMLCWTTASARPADVALLETGASAGDPRAQTELATRYQHAEGVARDLERANTLFCEAAKQGYAEAQYQLAWSYAYGRGTPRDDAVAAALFRMAAEQGHEYAARAARLVTAEPAAQLPGCFETKAAVMEAPATDTVARVDGGQDTAAAALLKVPAHIERLVRRLAPEYAVDIPLVLALIHAESAFNPTAVSPKNAQGLMQLIPETAARFGVKKPLNPVDNIRGGLAYLRWLLAFFRGNVPLVLAAYNAGEGAVEKHRGIPPYAETRNYVQKITRLYSKTMHPYEHGIVQPSALVSATTTVR